MVSQVINSRRTDGHYLSLSLEREIPWFQFFINLELGSTEISILCVPVPVSVIEHVVVVVVVSIRLCSVYDGCLTFLPCAYLYVSVLFSYAGKCIPARVYALRVEHELTSQNCGFDARHAVNPQPINGEIWHQLLDQIQVSQTFQSAVFDLCNIGRNPGGAGLLLFSLIELNAGHDSTRPV
jgi:hypothetical protein